MGTLKTIRMNVLRCVIVLIWNNKQKYVRHKLIKRVVLWFIVYDYEHHLSVTITNNDYEHRLRSRLHREHQRWLHTHNWMENKHHDNNNNNNNKNATRRFCLDVVNTLGDKFTKFKCEAKLENRKQKVTTKN